VTSLSVDHTDLWIVADLDQDPIAWARDVVCRRAAAEQVRLKPDVVEYLVEVMQPALRIAQDEDPPPVMVLFLCPRVDQPMVTSVKVRAEGVDPGLSLAELAEELRLPAEMLEQPAIEELVDTRSGTALHLIQRYREPEDAEVEQVYEHEIFGWLLEDEEGTLLVSLSTSYVDLVAAEAWRPLLLMLAASLAARPDPQE
jgi:hypothetical protein